MRPYRRFSNAGQMLAAALAFAAVGLVLDSGGLYEWAVRLELGPERSVALPAMTAVHAKLSWLGLERARRQALAGLAHVGWSDSLAAAGVALQPMPSRPPAGPPVVSLVEAAGRAAGGTAAAAAPKAAPAPTPVTPLLSLTDAPPLTTRLPPMEPVPAGRMRTVALVGDSMMAVGLATSMLREAPRYSDLNLVKIYQSGTGLARPEVFDWQTAYPAMLKGAHPDVVVVAMGANDGQGFVEDGVTYTFGSEAWKEMYQRRVQAFLRLLESGGATVVWIGMPPMKSASYDERIALINRIDYAVVSASPQAVWFSTAGLLGDANGGYEEFGRVHGSTARLRQPDGIHLSDEGAWLVAAKLLPWLGRSVNSDR